MLKTMRAPRRQTKAFSSNPRRTPWNSSGHLCDWDSRRTTASTIAISHPPSAASRGFAEFFGSVDRASHDAGKSFGGIYGKPAAQALTPANQVAELYDPAAFRRRSRTGRARRSPKRRWWRLYISLARRRHAEAVTNIERTKGG